MRTTLFLVTSLTVILVLSLLLNILGLNQPGVDWMPLLFMACIMGFAGTFISLMMSKSIAKRSSGAEGISSPQNETEAWLINTVSALAGKAGVGMPEVAIFSSTAPNAFATGANKNSSLVAVSDGL